MADEASVWERHGLEEKIMELLEGIPTRGHHFGRPYVTAYQLAIAFAQRYPETTKALGLPIGGVGTGKPNSPAQYLAGELSRRIKAGRIERIEGGLLSHVGLVELAYRHGERTVRSSALGGGGYDLSMFRVKEAG